MNLKKSIAISFTGNASEVSVSVFGYGPGWKKSFPTGNLNLFSSAERWMAKNGIVATTFVCDDYSVMFILPNSQIENLFRVFGHMTPSQRASRS